MSVSKAGSRAVQGNKPTRITYGVTIFSELWVFLYLKIEKKVKEFITKYTKSKQPFSDVIPAKAGISGLNLKD